MLCHGLRALWSPFSLSGINKVIWQNKYDFRIYKTQPNSKTIESIYLLSYHMADTASSDQSTGVFLRRFSRD